MFHVPRYILVYSSFLQKRAGNGRSPLASIQQQRSDRSTHTEKVKRVYLSRTLLSTSGTYFTYPNTAGTARVDGCMEGAGTLERTLHRTEKTYATVVLQRSYIHRQPANPSCATARRKHKRDHSSASLSTHRSAMTLMPAFGLTTSSCALAAPSMPQARATKVVRAIFRSSDAKEESCGLLGWLLWK